MPKRAEPSSRKVGKDDEEETARPANLDEGQTAPPSLRELIQRNAPVFVLDSNDEYFPCTIDDYLKHATLLDENEDVVLHYPDLNRETFAAFLAEEAKSKPPRLIGKGHSMVVVNEDIIRGSPDFKNVPVYVVVRTTPEYWDIMYWMFYAYNGALDLVCGLASGGAHLCDLEHITVRVSRADYLPRGYYYSAHWSFDGHWITDPVMTKADDGCLHPTVYVARNSHACYPDPGLWVRICGLANDFIVMNDDARVWAPIRRDLLLTLTSVDDEEPDVPYYSYTGNFGSGYVVSGFAARENVAGDGEPMYSNTLWRRVFTCGCDAVCCLASFGTC